MAIDFDVGGLFEPVLDGVVCALHLRRWSGGLKSTAPKSYSRIQRRWRQAPAGYGHHRFTVSGAPLAQGVPEWLVLQGELILDLLQQPVHA